MKVQIQNAFQIHKTQVCVNFEFKEGLNILTGPNGIGKSTFFHYLKGHYKKFFGEAKCAFMDQFPLSPLSELTGQDIIAILAEDLPSFKQEKVELLAQAFNIVPLLQNKVESYSGGENQIFKFLLLAGQEADYYFLDEPLQYLDDKNAKLLLHSLQEFERGNFLMIEHRKDKLENLSAQFIRMEKKENEIVIGESWNLN